MKKTSNEELVTSIIDQIYSIVSLSRTVGKAQERKSHTDDTFARSAYDALITDLASKAERKIDNLRDVLNKLIRKDSNE